MRMAVDAALHDSESFGSPGLASALARAGAPRRPAEAGRQGAGRAQVFSRPDLGIITWAWTVLNQHDEAVLELDATSLFDLSGNAWIRAGRRWRLPTCPMMATASGPAVAFQAFTDSVAASFNALRTDAGTLVLMVTPFLRMLA